MHLAELLSNGFEFYLNGVHAFNPLSYHRVNAEGSDFPPRRPQSHVIAQSRYTAESCIKKSRPDDAYPHHG